MGEIKKIRKAVIPAAGLDQRLQRVRDQAKHL